MSILFSRRPWLVAVSLLALTTLAPTNAVAQTPSIALTGAPTSPQSLEFAGAATTYTITVVPSPAAATWNTNLNARAQVNAVVDVDIAATGTAGEWTLIVTPPTFDTTALTDTVTITATATDPDDSSNRVTATATIDFEITLTVRDAAVISGLDGLTFAPDTPAFDFGDGARTFNFKVSPDVPVSISSATSTLFETWKIVETGAGTYTLTVKPSGSDPAVGYYSETLTITATEDGRTPATQDLIFTITPPATAITITGLDSPDTSPFNFSEGARTFTFNVEPSTATFTFSDSSLFTIMKTDDDGAGKAFTIAPPATDGGTYTDTVTITVTNGSTTATQQITFTINPPPPPTPTITFSGLAATQTVDFGATQNVSFRVNPRSVDLTYSVSPVTTPPLVVVPGTNRFIAGFIIQAPATDSGTSEYTITVTASATGYTETTSDVTVNVTAAPTQPVALSGALITDPSVSLEYAAAARMYTITADPVTATLETITTTGAVRASIEPAFSVRDDGTAINGTLGEWILTLVASTTGNGLTDDGTALTDTVTITATADDRITTTHDIDVTVTPRAAATFTDSATGNSLVTGAQPAFDFGEGARTYNFTVSPDTVSVSISPTTSNVFSTWNLADNTGGSYTLSIQPLADDPGTATSYSETLTITATEDGRTPASQDLTFTIAPIELTGLPATARTPFAFSGVSRTQTFNFAVTPTDPQFTATVAGTATNGVTAEVDANGNRFGLYSLTVTAPTTDNGEGPYTDTVTVTATDPVGKRRTVATHDMEITLTPAPITLSGLPIGTQSAAAAQTYTISVVPPTIELSASSADSVVGATIACKVALDGAGKCAAGEWTLTVTPPATGTTFVDTVTITATDPDLATARTEVTEDIDFTSTRTFTGLSDANTAAFNFGDRARDITFSVNPAAVPISISPTSSNLFSIWNLANNGGGTYTLTIQPVAIDPYTSTSYSETLTVTASEDGRTGVSRELVFTINPSPFEIVGLPASASPFIFDGDTGDTQTFNFTVSPATATFTATVASAATYELTAEVTGTGADRTLTVTAPPTDTGAGPYKDTITVTASAPDLTDVTHDLAITLIPAQITLSVMPIGTETSLGYGSAETLTYTATVTPPTIELAAGSNRDTADVMLTNITNNGGGNHTLTVSAPNTGSLVDPKTGLLLVNTVTTTATDPAGLRTEITNTIRFSVTPRAAATFSFTGPHTVDTDTTDGTLTFTVLVDTGVTETFDFGDDVRTINFSVSPATAQATISPTTSNLFSTWNLASGGAAGSYTLTIQPVAADPDTGASYSEILTVAAAEDGRETATFPLTFTINPSPVDVTGLPTGADLTLEYGAAASTFTLTVFPTAATFTFTATPANGVVMADVTGSGATRTLTVTPPSTGTTYTDTVTITATDLDDEHTQFSQTLTFTVTPPEPVLLTGTLITDRAASIEYASAATEYTITADPATATLTAASANSVVGANIVRTAPDAPTWTLTLTAPTTGNTYTDTITITATDPTRTDTTVPITVTVSLLAAATFTDLATADVSAFDFDDAARTISFSVDPTDVEVEISPTSSTLFTEDWSLTDNGGGSYTLSIQPAATDPATGSYSETLTITATEDGRLPATQELTFTINTVPAAPTGVVAVAGDAQLTVSWTAVPPANNGGTTILTYTATATDTTDSTMTFACTATGAAATTCANPITGLNNGTEYSVAVVATNSAGDSAPSTAAMATPMDLSTATAPTAAPTILSLVAGDAQLTVSWTVVPDANNGGANIAVYTATATDTTNEANTFACTAAAPTAAPTCDITDLTNGVEYSVTVVATNGVGDSEPSTAMTATLPTVPAAPTGVTLSAGNQSIEVTWAVGPPAAILGYTAIATAPGRTDQACTAGAADTTCDIFGLANGVEYSVIVIASNSAGDSPESNPATATPMTTVPTVAPTNVMLGVGDTQLTVSWTAVPPANNGGSPITGYTATTAADAHTCTTASRTDTACDLTGLTNGVAYEVTVVATNRVGNSPGSTPVTATPATVPTAALILSPTTLTLNEGSTTTYTVRLATEPSATVTVNITGHANTDVTLDSTSLSFTTGNWDTAQTVTLTANDDNVINDYTAPLTHTASGGDYDNIIVGLKVFVTNTDTAPMFSFTDIADQTYPVGNAITPLTLPAATGGVGTLTYTLAPEPAGLTFDAAASPTVNGTPTTVDTHVLIYTVTDSATPTPQTTSLTFEVMVVREMDVTAGDTGDISLDLDGNADTDTDGAILALPVGHTISTVILGVASQNATTNPPTGIDKFTLTIDIALAPGTELPPNTFATVCLPTTGVPDGRVPVLYHYTSRDENAEAWHDIGRDITTRTGYVCGETMTFSPFGVGPAAEATAARLHEQILTRVSQAITAGTLAAVSARMDAAARSAGGGVSANAAAPTLAYQLGGQSSMRDLLQAHGKSMLEGDMDYSQLLDGASFVIPLSAAGDNSADNSVGTLAVWGGIDYRNLGSDEEGLDWDGGISNFYFGIDGLVSEKILAGVALSGHRAEFDYESTVVSATGSGDYRYDSTNINPYLGWFPSKNVKLWASAGFGSGEVKIDEVVNADETGGEYATDTTQSSFAVGFSSRLLRGATNLSIKGDVALSKVELERAEGIMQQDVNSSRTRLLLSGEKQRELASGGVMTPSLEVGGRSDSGDGITGTGVELGGGLRYTNSAGNLVVSGNVRALLAHDYDEWGADVNMRMLSSSGRGLSLSVNPVWGKTQSAAERLWDDGANGVSAESGDGELQRSLAAEVGYGIGATMLGSAGLLTPYLGMSADEVGVGRVRLGGRFAGGNGLSLDLEGAQRNTEDGASHMVLLRGELAF